MKRRWTPLRGVPPYNPKGKEEEINEDLLKIKVDSYFDREW